MSFLRGLTVSAVEIFAPLVKMVLKSVLLDMALPALKAKDPKAYAVALAAIYGPIDVYLEEIVHKTDTKIDDAVVEALMESIEEAARKDGIPLPDIDAGTGG